MGKFQMKSKTYIRTDVLKPADVILSRSPHKESKIISKFTKGPYSHASLVLSSTHRFEALDDGVGMTYIKISRAEYHPDQAFWLLEDASSYAHVEVYRHPALSNIQENETQTRLLEIIQLFNGLEYPELKKLAIASSASPFVQKIASVLLGTIDRANNQHKVIPGPFCSELIMLVFKALGFPLFDTNMEPNTVSPNNLAHSHLRKVPEAICHCDGSIPNDIDLVNEINSLEGNLSRDTPLRTLVTGKKLLKISEDMHRRFVALEQHMLKIIEQYNIQSQNAPSGKTIAEDSEVKSKTKSNDQIA
jgi:hypothetical protein